MTIQILKYPLELTDHQMVTMPQIFRELTVQLQRDQLCLWIMGDLNDGLDLLDYDVYIWGTGHPIPPERCDDIWLGTAQQGQFVWHVFLGINADNPADDDDPLIAIRRAP